MYTIARKDRAGAFIKDMICAHVYASSQQHQHQQHQHWVYAGACNIKPQRRPVRLYQLSALKLLTFIGLEHELPFYGPSVVCPPDVVLLNGTITSSNTTTSILVSHQETYDGFDHACSRGLEQWRHQMAPALALSPAAQPTNRQQQTGGAVLHIRRGDVTPCSSMPWVSNRYLSNRYYQRLMKEYIPPNMPVTIYSERSSFEPWGENTNGTFFFDNDDDNGTSHRTTTSTTTTLRLDTPLHQVWQHIMTADVYILSRDSAFSYVPALLNVKSNATILFTPSTYFQPLPTWTVVSNATVEFARRELERLQHQYCPSKKQ
mmetsp:Transcript_15799/g.26478  ORF Transcript_15799/g.26478 Transcript_15799/m.26478 type:complete len:318 (-) Transcript_15799:63-1016(-)